MSLVWSALAATIAFAFLPDRRAAGVIGLVACSHWALDFVVHPPDLHLFFGGSPAVGLGLYTSGPGLVTSTTLELGLLVGGTAIYLATGRRASARAR